eukprot:CAMPEP_0181243066 /NCGR_PEP_ID=MMETSP1096-20121128/42043_1 /TAXON_ID=156174 ORGANISM="Chrysochromulina ericina, Strain CCMP281" /NCGR_SAMPLE_ID=MMETSP1096 /ASSEMBLY_ACC=CAM_ASM_000453 /LENGTH=187 /DNA_ID=CAMNT_0023339353 /DNA_START=20 /DNA_END=583 /DNA_ORIENTATION=-
MAMHTGGHVQLLRKAATHVDRVHLMAYDMPDADERGRHSTEQAAKDAVAFAISVGIPREKLVLGIPMYGRDTSNPGHAETYRELRPKRRPEDMEDFVGSIFYNGPSTVRRKAAFAAEQGLAGVFFWELGQDDTSDSPQGAPLLRAAASVGDLAMRAGWVAGKAMESAAAAALLTEAEKQPHGGKQEL